MIFLKPAVTQQMILSDVQVVSEIGMILFIHHWLLGDEGWHGA